MKYRFFFNYSHLSNVSQTAVFALGQLGQSSSHATDRTTNCFLHSSGGRNLSHADIPHAFGGPFIMLPANSDVGHFKNV